MTRALIVGPRDGLSAAVDALYDLKLLHLVDHQPGEEDLDIGTPLPTAADASEVLVKLRSVANVLQVEEPKSTEPLEPVPGDVREKILSLELNISEEDAARKKVQSLLQDLNRRIEEITPFAQLPLRLEDYRGYETLDVLPGRVSREVTGLETVTPEFELFQTPGFVAVAVPKDKAPAVRDFLGRFGFAAMAAPQGQGHPRETLAELLAEKERWEKRATEIDERLTNLREKYAGFLAAAKAHLEVEVEKAEAPLRFAVTEHTFIVEGWVPSETFSTIQAELEKLPGMFVAQLETKGEEHEEPEAADPPVLLKNVKPFKPFETLVNLFGTPNYKEIDPTFLVASVFPIFFGIMVSDAGYGLAWVLFGAWAVKRYLKTPFWKDVITAITWGGFWAFLFGFFVFAEAFGIPFHAPPGSQPGTAAYFNWSDNILHVNIPIHPLMEKLTQVPDFIVLAVLAAYIHLGIGFITGFLNDVRHNLKHAAGKAAWFVILTSLFFIILARSARWPIDAAGRVPLGYALWNGPLAWFPHGGITYASVGFDVGNPIPMVALYMLVGGLVVMLLTEGALHIMEIFGLLANMISYARLAGIGVAEEAVTFALNSIILGGLIIPGTVAGGATGILQIIGGLAFFVLAQIVLFLLYAISATIQSIRLNYVEFFLKFYKGTGTLFRPFGERTKSEV